VTWQNTYPQLIRLDFDFDLGKFLTVLI